jgi:hypothetical protein
MNAQDHNERIREALQTYWRMRDLSSALDNPRHRSRIGDLADELRRIIGQMHDAIPDDVELS